MHRRSFVLGLFGSVSVLATMSATAAAEALAARASELGDHDLVEFGDQFGFFFGRRRRRFGRRRGSRSARRSRSGGGGGGGPPAEAATGSGTGSRAADPILSTTKPVPLSDQPAPPRAGARPASR
jgi:hypothetical protein